MGQGLKWLGIGVDQELTIRFSWTINRERITFDLRTQIQIRAMMRQFPWKYYVPLLLTPTGACFLVNHFILKNIPLLWTFPYDGLNWVILIPVFIGVYAVTVKILGGKIDPLHDPLIGAPLAIVAYVGGIYAFSWGLVIFVPIILALTALLVPVAFVVCLWRKWRKKGVASPLNKPASANETGKGQISTRPRIGILVNPPTEPTPNPKRTLEEFYQETRAERDLIAARRRLQTSMNQKQGGPPMPDENAKRTQD